MLQFYNFLLSILQSFYSGPKKVSCRKRQMWCKDPEREALYIPFSSYSLLSLPFLPQKKDYVSSAVMSWVHCCPCTCFLCFAFMCLRMQAPSLWVYPSAVGLIGVCFLISTQQLFQKLKNLMRPYSVEFESPLELSAQGGFITNTHHVPNTPTIMTQTVIHPKYKHMSCFKYASYGAKSYD